MPLRQVIYCTVDITVSWFASADDGDALGRINKSQMARRTLRCFSSVASRGVNTDVADAMKYCHELVRTHDFESYLCGISLPRQTRSAMFAVLGYHIELGMIRKNAQGNEAASRVRLQFWNDVIDCSYEINNCNDKSGTSSLPTHLSTPVSTALQAVVAQGWLSRRWLQRPLEARLADLDTGHAPWETLDDAKHFAEGIWSSALYSSMECCLVSSSPAGRELTVPADAMQCASHIGRARGLVAMLRSVPAQVQHVQSIFRLLPRDCFAEIDGEEKKAAGVDIQAQLSAFLPVAAKNVATEISEQLMAATRIVTAPDSHAAVLPVLPVLRMATPSRMYLSRLERASHDVLSPELQQTQTLKIMFELMKCGLLKKI